METTCSSLLSELRKIWDEVGEPDTERDRMLFELEKECLDVYRRKVDQASQCRTQLRQAVASSEAELAHICSALGERPMYTRQNSRSLKMELQAIIPLLQEIQRRKKERKIQFTEVLEQIHNISEELCSHFDENAYTAIIDETDLSLKMLEELKIQLIALQKEKSDRLKQVLDHLSTINSLCSVLGLDFKHTVSEIHPTLDGSFGAKSISPDTIERLSTVIYRLKELKAQRMQKLQELAAAMVELWTLMDTPVEEQQNFQNVTKNLAASEDEITEANTLSLDFINHAEVEVLRLQKMKSSKIKEVLLKKKLHLDEIYRVAHMVVHDNTVDYSIETIESGAIDPSYLLEQVELQISKAKEEAFSRKEILDRIEKWMAACEEESWLEEYNRDDNRYNAGRGTHLILKRAEKARALVSKLPGMVELLTSKAKAWEKERGMEFNYDGVSLLSVLDKYRVLQQEKEQERQRQRDQKKIQGQLIAEQEALFGSKPSPKTGRKNSGTSNGVTASKRFSMGGMMLQTPHTAKTMRYSHVHRNNNALKQQSLQNHHLNGSLAQPSGKRDTSAVPAKRIVSDSPNLCETESKLIRKPLSAISSSLSSSEANSANLHENNKDRELLDTLSMNEIPLATPNGKISASDENETPKTMPIPIPKTPSTVSVAMQMAVTPATPCIPKGERVEYSFEEKRAGFVLSNSH